MPAMKNSCRKSELNMVITKKISLSTKGECDMVDIK